MSIILNDAIKVNAPKPIDVRYIVGDYQIFLTKESIPISERYEGLLVYVIEEKVRYELIGGIQDINWKLFSGYISDGSIKSDLVINLTQDESRVSIPGEYVDSAFMVFVNGTYIRKDDYFTEYTNPPSTANGTLVFSFLLEMDDEVDLIKIHGATGDDGSGVVVGDHTQLINRNFPDQHQIVSITGLQSILDSKEDYLGIPATGTRMLTSDIGGIRSWIEVSHTNLIDNDVVDQHPITSIINLDTELGQRVTLGMVGAANGVAPLDNLGIVPSIHLPSIVSKVTSLTGNQLTVADTTSTPKLTIVTGAVISAGTALATGDQIYDFVTGLVGSKVDSFNTRTGVVSLTKADVEGVLTGTITSHIHSYTNNDGTITSVAQTVPTGFVVTGSPITVSGTLAIGFDNGYSLPTTLKQGQWDVAYGWGDHAGLYDSIGTASALVINHETTYNHANYNTAFGWGNHAGLYDPVGTAVGLVSTHESTYNHNNYNTAYGWGNHAGLYEPELGNPTVDGHVLSSTVLGVRTWTELPVLHSSFNAQTGTTYTLLLTDDNKTITLSNASAITLTVPPNSSVAFEIGTRIEIIQKDVGQVTVVEGSGVTINSADGNLNLRTKYSMVVLIKESADAWYLGGDIE